MAKATTPNLLVASHNVLKLAAERRERMAGRTTTATATKTAKPAAKPAKVAAAPVVEAPKAKADEPAVAAPAAPAVEAAAVKAVENGGFAEDMKVVKDSEVDTGSEDWGVHIPPEIETEVEDGKEETEDMPLPGIMIPEGLEDSVMAVADPAVFTGDTEVRFDLTPFVPASCKTTQDILTAGAHWVLFANGDPLAKISLKDQEHAAQIVAHFVSADFARSIMDGISKRGLTETLSAVKAKAYVAKVDEAKKVKEIKAKLESSAEESLRQRIASIKAKYVENIGLVLEASSNNFIVENSVKDALIAGMSSLGIPEATAAQMADDVFFQYGQKTIAGFLDKAEAWSNTSPEAIREIKAAMQSAGRRSRPLPSALGAAHTNPNYNQSLANQMAASAVPVVSSSNSESTISASLRVNSQVPVESSKKDDLRARIGRFSLSNG